MTSILFDDTGRSWASSSPALHAAFGCPSPDFDLPRYLINNIGFVELARRQSRAARIRFRPRSVAPAGLAAALFALCDGRQERIVVSCEGAGSCRDRLFVSLAQAIDHVNALVVASRAPAAPPFLARERPLSALRRGPLSLLVDNWISSGGVLDGSCRLEELAASLRGRFMVLTPSPSGRLLIDRVGDGFVAYDAAWRSGARGQPVENQPDYAYGQWVKAMFEDAFLRWRPRLDDIDATLCRPFHQDRVRVRYRRLILPYRCRTTGEPCLIGASTLDDSIDLSPTEGQTARP